MINNHQSNSALSPKKIKNLWALCETKTLGPFSYNINSLIIYKAVGYGAGVWAWVGGKRPRHQPGWVWVGAWRGPWGLAFKSGVGRGDMLAGLLLLACFFVLFFFNNLPLPTQAQPTPRHTPGTRNQTVGGLSFHVSTNAPTQAPPYPMV
ncbi:hypothetical protein HanRHA438_Chr03g0104521 [Helianthus annuus]|nr:hypothetical protein HanRHA438_Chr03g0104521 [Helianthus annuus]